MFNPSSPRPIPLRGDIWWADFPQYEGKGSEQEGKRPVVILSPKPLDVLVISVDSINVKLPICTFVPLSAQVHKANRQFRILIPESQKIQELGTKGSQGDSLALTEQTRCISIERLLDQKRVARLKTEALGAVEAGVRFILGIP